MLILITITTDGRRVWAATMGTNTYYWDWQKLCYDCYWSGISPYFTYNTTLYVLRKYVSMSRNNSIQSCKVLLSLIWGIYVRHLYVHKARNLVNAFVNKSDVHACLTNMYCVHCRLRCHLLLSLLQQRIEQSAAAMAKTAAAVAVKAYEEGGGKQDINKSDKQPVCCMLLLFTFTTLQ